MAVVLATTSGNTRSGLSYDDRTGVSYEYPSGKYEKYIVPGERFVYQRVGGGYIGCGVIGAITASTSPDRLVCEILDYQPFAAEVSLKRGRRVTVL